MSFWKWSTLAATNATADSTAPWPEGMAPSAVNDSARGVMAAAAKYRDDVSGNLVTGGTSTAYTITTNQVLSALTDGFKVTARIHATSGASPTLAVDGLTAKPIRTVYGTNVPTGVLLINSVWSFVYDSTDEGWIALGSPGATVPVSATTLAASGATTLSSTLAVTGNVAVNTDKFTVTAASGNTLVAGTLAVTGASTLTGAVGVTGALTAQNSAGIAGRNVIKASCAFTLSGTTVTFTAGNHFNCATAVRNSTGNYTITFTNALPTANYVVVGSAGYGAAAPSPTVGMTLNTTGTRNTTDFTIITRDSSSATTAEATMVELIVVGF